MSTATATPPPAAPSPAAPPVPLPPGFRYYLAQALFRRFTLAEYHKMIQTGVLREGEPYELLEGHLVHKMARGTLHDSVVQSLTKRLVRMTPDGWEVRAQCAITLTDGSEPEPDFALVLGDDGTFRTRHPGPAEIGIVVEVSDSSLAIDRHDKGRIYAREGIPVYWVVSIPDKRIEVYTQPGGTGDDAAYARRDDFAPGASVPVVLAGTTVGQVAVSDVLGQ